MIFDAKHAGPVGPSSMKTNVENLFPPLSEFAAWRIPEPAD